MLTVKLYKTTITQGYMMGECGDCFAFSRWQDGAGYVGYDDGGKLYRLPDGYRIEPSSTWESLGDTIVDDRGNPCEVFVHSSGRPQIVSARGMPVMVEAG